MVVPTPCVRKFFRGGDGLDLLEDFDIGLGGGVAIFMSENKFRQTTMETIWSTVTQSEVRQAHGVVFMQRGLKPPH